MSKIWFHLGDSSFDYRSLMRTQQDFVIQDRQIPIANLVIAEQTHSDLVHICTPDDSGAGLGDHPQIAVADAFATDIPNQFLLIRTADCTPVLLYESSGKAVAAIHSGREGTRKNIVGKAVDVLVNHYGCQRENIIAYIGAGVSEAHYEVSFRVFEEYNASITAMGITPLPTEHRHINVRCSIFQQLLHCGISFKNIENIHICTYEDQSYFSFRRDGTHNRQINLIGIVNE